MKKIIWSIIIFVILMLSSILPGCDTQQKNQPEEIPDYPFFGKTVSGDDSDIATINNFLFENFSGTEGTDCLVYRFGNEATYFEWVAEKILFTTDNAYKDELKLKIQNYPQTDTGYLWSWSTSTWWPTGNGGMHYDGIFRYVSAVWDIVRYENDMTFLDKKCEVGETSGINGTLDKTIYQKCDLAITYAINYLEGKTGVIHLTEDSMYLADGVTRIDKKGDVYLWNNTGKAGSDASNYWDNLCFGGYDAYETMLFYHALQDMIEIEKLYNHTQKVQEYQSILQLVHQKYDEYFWNEETGRYIGCIDEDGNKMDFGLTFLNTESLAYGLGDKQKANLIFSWLDGTRIVEGDNITGQDIFNYTTMLNNNRKWYNKLSTSYYLAPVSNTKAIESYQDENGNYWWFDLEGSIKIDKKSSNASYGKHLENGGYIFYTVYYELLARAKYQSAEKIATRYKQIADVYCYNRLNSDEGNWVEGLIDEFPESGLVYMSYLYTMLGINIRDNTLIITPNTPSDCENLGVKDFVFASQPLTINTTKNSFSVMQQNSNISVKIGIDASPETTYLIKTYDENGTFIEEKSYSFTEETFFVIPHCNDTKTLYVSWE